MIAREMLEMLFSGSHECHIVDRAERALEFLEFQPDGVVITDISMPGLGGVEILRRIRQLHEGTPVIVISARANAYKDSLLGMGVFACFAEPFALGDLEDAVNPAIASHQQSGCLPGERTLLVHHD